MDLCDVLEGGDVLNNKVTTHYKTKMTSSNCKLRENEISYCTRQKMNLCIYLKMKTAIIERNYGLAYLILINAFVKFNKNVVGDQVKNTIHTLVELYDDMTLHHRKDTLVVIDTMVKILQIMLSEFGNLKLCDDTHRKANMIMMPLTLNLKQTFLEIIKSIDIVWDLPDNIIDEMKNAIAHHDWHAIFCTSERHGININPLNRGIGISDLNIALKDIINASKYGTIEEVKKIAKKEGFLINTSSNDLCIARTFLKTELEAYYTYPFVPNKPFDNIGCFSKHTHLYDKERFCTIYFKYS